MSRDDHVKDDEFETLRHELERALAAEDDVGRAAVIAGLKNPIYAGCSYSAAQRKILWEILRPHLFGKGRAPWQAAVMLTSHLSTQTTPSEVISILADPGVESDVKDALAVSLVRDIESGQAGPLDIEMAESLLSNPSFLTEVQDDCVSELKSAVNKRSKNPSKKP